MAVIAREGEPVGTSSRQAVACGALGERPLPRLLHQLFRKRITGCLVVTDDAGDESAVYLREGLPVHLDRLDQLDRLPRVAVEAGVLSEYAVSSLGAGSDEAFAQAVIARGLCTPAALADVLKLQLRRKLVRLFFARKGRFDIYLDPHEHGSGEAFATMRVDPRCVVYPGIRAAYDEGRLEEELAPLQNHSFRLVSALPAALLEAMGFPRADPTVALLGAQRVTLADLPPAGAKPVEARAAVLALLYTDLLEATTLSAPAPRATVAMPVAAPASPPAPAPAARASGPVPVAATAAPPSPSAMRTSGSMPAATAPVAGPTTGDPALRARIEDLFARLSALSHFDLLAIGEVASGEEVAAAYMRNIRQLHPDRLASVGLKDLTEKAERVVAQMNEAQAVLADPRRRAEYVAARAGKAPAADTGQSILHAEETFQKGEVYLRKGDYTRAVECFATAMREGPLEPAYKAHWAFARWSAPGAAKEALAHETINILEELLKERPKSALTHYWLGLLRKSLGDAQAAESSFRAALAQNKNLLEAEREIRLIEMRRTRGSQNLPAAADPKPQAGSAARTTGKLLDRLLKR
jgi:hypothetical protein